MGQLVEAARLEGIAQQKQVQEITKQNVELYRKIEEQDEAFKQFERSQRGQKIYIKNLEAEKEEIAKQALDSEQKLDFFKENCKKQKLEIGDLTSDLEMAAILLEGEHEYNASLVEVLEKEKEELRRGKLVAEEAHDDLKVQFNKFLDDKILEFQDSKL